MGSSSSLSAILTAEIVIGGHGAMTLTNGESCGTGVKLVGLINNTGSITTETAHGGARELQGSLTNTGTLTFNVNTSYNGSKTTLTNEGALNIADNVALSVSGSSSVINGAGGSIVVAGTEHPGDLTQSGGTFTEGAGTTTGVKPVIVDDGALTYTGAGKSLIALHGEGSTLSGTSSTGQALLIESTCGEHAVITANASFTNNGVLELTNGDGCGNNATLNMKSGTLTNIATLNVDNPHGGNRTIEGNLVNTEEGALLLASGKTLQVTGNYTQTSLAKLKTVIAGTSEFGALAVTGTATLNGRLKLIQSPTFKGALEQKYPVITAGSRTGEFALEAEGELNATGLYYQPIYSSTGVTLVVT